MYGIMRGEYMMEYQRHEYLEMLDGTWNIALAIWSNMSDMFGYNEKNAEVFAAGMWRLKIILCCDKLFLSITRMIKEKYLE